MENVNNSVRCDGGEDICQHLHGLQTAASDVFLCGNTSEKANLLMFNSRLQSEAPEDATDSAKKNISWMH